jgi:TolB-like protein/predicted negative regulator of RcsB-dependent stress response
MSLIAELRRRNVFRAALAYLAGGWLLVQVVESLLPAFNLPDSAIRYVFILLAIGFVPLLVGAWVFEWTPAGLTRDRGESTSTDPASNRRVDRAIMVMLSLAVILFATHTFIIDPARDKARIDEVAREVRSGAYKSSFGTKSIAVLPFANLSADPEQEYFGDGIAEELLNLLAQIEGLRVISRTSSFNFRDTKLSIAEIAAKLDVAHILEGSVRRDDDTIRITAQLIDAEADTHLWSETYDRQFEDIFAIQDDVARQVVDQLQLVLDVGVPETERHDPEAYALFLRAKHFLDRDDPDHTNLAAELLLRALEIDPGYIDAEAYLGLAYTRLSRQWALDGDTETALEYQARAAEARQRVLEKAPKHSFMNAMLGFEALFENDDIAAASRHIEASLDTDPRIYHGLLAAAAVASDLGRTDLAIRIGEYITSRDPMGFWGHSNLGDAYLARGDAERAIAAYRAAAAVSPKAPSIHWKLAFAHTFNGEPEVALERLVDEVHLPYQLHGRALAHYDLGENARAEALMDELLDVQADDDGGTIWDFGLARAYAWMGDVDNALKYLRLEDSEIRELFGVTVSPYFTRIRDDHRWQALASRIDEEASRIRFDPRLPPEILAMP